MKVAILLILMLLLVGCKTKQTSKYFESDHELTKKSSKNDSIGMHSKILNHYRKEESQQLEHNIESFTESEIKGKSETDKPVEFYNVEKGDTVQSIKVVGNADVYIKTKSSRTERSQQRSSADSFTEKLKEFSQRMVEENNINERVSQMKKKTKEVRLNGFQAGAWIFITLLGIFLIIIFFIYKYFKK